MGDMGDDFKEMKLMKQERKLKRYEKNISILVADNIRYEIRNSGNTLLIREEGKPKIDFYPSTGRFKIGSNFYTGGATELLKYYKGEKHA